MTPAQFRQTALSMPEAVEAAHHGKADFRVRKKIFATLDTLSNLGTLKLTPQDQTQLIDALGDTAFPANGSWGAKGWTKLILPALPDDITFWMKRAWTITAPATLHRTTDL